MADVIINAIQKLKALPPELHWFCSRCKDDETDRCYDEDWTAAELEAETEDEKEARQKRAESALERKRLVLEAVQIFAFDGVEAKPLQEWVEKELNRLMQICDVCVRTYHAARVELVEKLSLDYEVEEVGEFMNKFDGINVERIKRGLQYAERQLLHLPVEKRRVGNLDPEGLYALFEAMNSEPYLRNEELLSGTFDEPFRLVQTKKQLRLPAYLPACTYFIFSANKDRSDWAKIQWSKLARPPTQHEFEFMIKKPLEVALRRVQVQALEVQALPSFWLGMSVLTSKLTSEAVTHSLRPMEIARLTLDHFSLREIDVPTFVSLTSTWKDLLEKSPDAFWDSMRSIPSKAIIEQCFRSPAMHEVLLRPTADAMPRMEDIFAWIQPFIASIKGSKVPACAALVREFMARSRNEQLDQAARSYCFTLALHILDQTLKGMIKPQRYEDYVGSAVAAEMLEQITEHLPMLMRQGRGIKNGAMLNDDKGTALSIVEHAVALDCLTLVQDKKAVQFQKARSHTAPKSSSAFWKPLVDGIGSGDQALATRVLLGAREIVGLEKFPAKFSPRAPEDAKGFAAALDARCDSLSNFLERMSDFPSYQLAGLFKTAETADSIVHLLFCSQASVRQAAVDILKTMTDKTDRLETIWHVLDDAFFSFLSALTKSTSELAGKATFPPMPGMVKLCGDVVNALCSTSNGLLRTRNLTSEDVDATRAFWRFLWSASTTIFKNMEQWGTEGHDKHFMMDFCRDTMQFADTLFDQYSVFLNVIVEEYDEEQQRRDKAKQLLQHPRNAMEDMVRWLRLRDEFLIEKALALVTGLMGRLTKGKVEASDTALDYIEAVATKNTKTNLKQTQLAVLRDAIDKYSDRQIVRQAMDEKKKAAAKQTSLNSWAKSGGRTKEDAIDLDSDASDSVRQKTIKDATQGLERFKKLKEQAKAKEAAANKKAVPAPKKNLLNPNEFLKKRRLEEEEARKKKAALAAAARGNIPGPGSALNSLGLATKDHSTKGQGVMVDSDEDSSESESDDDSDENDLDRELFGPSKKSARAANAMSEAEAKKLLPAGPVKVRKIQRSARDMRARLVPDLSKLHQEILSWDYFHKGYYPPNSRDQDYKSVPKAMDDPKTYMDVFKPLLVLETWRKICNDKDQESQNRPYEFKVLNRSSVDAFAEVNTSMQHPMGDQGSQVSEGDLVLLSNARNPRSSPDSPSCLARIHKISRKKQHIEVLYRVVPNGKFASKIAANMVINAFKIDSLITVEREYGALMGLQFYDLNEFIMQAAPSKLLKYANSVLDPLMQNYKLNQAQAKAVKSALDNDAFTLIQGPPGSGKTKTIVATVGALLSETLKNSAAPVKRPGMSAAAVTSSANSKKLLICAPSNAAVDELVLRFMEGIRTTSGQDKKINVVRLGRSEKINQQVLSVTLEELVSARLNKAAGSSESQRQETQKLMAEHKEVSGKLNEAHDQKDALEQKNENVSHLMDDINALRRRKKELSMLIDQAKDKEQMNVRQNDLEKKRAEQQVLDEAHILCATLSASGHERFQNLSLEFETVIVDEAAQCTELQALIPLKYGAAKCILVGDPKQLPPTTFMDAKLNFQYEQSLFVRMQNNSPQDVHLLDTQYRMHPEISSFPSQQFYDSLLLDGDNMAKLRAKPWHKDPILGPYRFFDVQGQQTFTGSSLTNKMEIDAAMQLYDKLNESCSTYDFKGKIGIITPYKAQFNAMKRRFQDEYGKGVLDAVEFNTTDAFQGRECEIIIFSCVRASEGSIGFLSDYRRMNVGLTRAKCSLWVLGNTKSLVNGKYWRAMIEDAQKRNRISPVADIGKGRPSAPGSYRPVHNHVSKLNYEDGDVGMGGSSGVNSSNNSRRSSASSMSTNSRPIPTGPAKDSVKMEYAERIKPEPRDVDMKDVFSSDDASVKSERKDFRSEIKQEKPVNSMPQEHRIQAPRPPPKANGPGPGYLAPPSRAPGQMPVKRKKPNGALLENKRRKH